MARTLGSSIREMYGEGAKGVWEEGRGMVMVVWFVDER